MNAVAAPAVRQLLRVGPAPRLALELAGRGPLVLCLHGIGGNRHAWDAQLAALAGEFTVAAWDARGYGDSDDYDGALDFGDFSRDLVRVLDHLRVGAVHLVGQSMGGRIALDFYARHPSRIATLTLVDTSAGSARVASPEEVEKFLRLRKQPLLEGRTPRDIAPGIADTLVGPGTPPAVRERVIESLAALHVQSYLKTLDTVTRYTSFPDFASIAVPTLVVVGEHDRIATPQYARDMAARIPGARFVELAGGSHVSNMDRAEDFNRELLAFLRAHAGRAAAIEATARPA
jgi:3-oxoadipate enol-lactonase